MLTVEDAETLPADTSGTTDAPARRELSGLGQWCLVLSCSVMVLFGAAFVTSIVGLVRDIRVGGWILVPSLAVQIWFTFYAWRKLRPPTGSLRAVAVTLLVGWLAIVAAGVVSQLVSDTTVDGEHYQSESVHAIAEGWNPTLDPALNPTGTPTQPDATPKAPWLLEATVLRVTDDIETISLVGMVLLLAAALLAIAALDAAGAPLVLAVAGGAALALNPVALTQLGAGLVDGIVSSLLLASIVIALLWVWGHPPALVIPSLAAALVLLANTTFGGVVSIGIIVLPVLVIAGLLNRLGWQTVKMVLGVIVVTAVGVVLLGYNPYLTSSMRHGEAFYPDYGATARDIGQVYRTGVLRDASEPERLLRSIGGVSQSAKLDQGYKIPFTFTGREWSAFGSPTVRIGGFGPLFSGALVLTLIGLGLAAVMRAFKPGFRASAGLVLLAVAGVCLVSVLVQPSSFLARFAPQLWFVPVFAGVVLVLATRSTAVRVLGWVLLSVLLVNAFGVGLVAAKDDYRDQKRENNSLDRLAEVRGPLQVELFNRRTAEELRLSDHGIRFHRVSRVMCDNPFILGSHGRLTHQSQTEIVRPVAGVILCPAPPQ